MKFWFLLRGINWKYYTIIVWYQSVGCRPITLTPKCTILFYNSALQLPTFLEIIHSIITLHPDSVTKIASACLHNFLCARRSEAYMTPGVADWEDVDHRVNEGAWRRDGPGTMQCVSAERSRNPTLAAKQQRDLLKDYFVSPAGQVPWQEKYI